MLIHQPWLRLGNDIRVEFEQCLREGRDVAGYEGVVNAFVAMDNELTLKNEAAVEAVAREMACSPIREDFPFEEPSDLPSILAASPSADKPPVLPELPDEETLMDRLQGAWIGRIAGCLLGKPVEGWRRDRLWPVLKATGNWPMKGYILKSAFTPELIEEHKLWTGACFADNVRYASPVDDDTNYTTFALKLVTRYGRDFTPADVAEGWLSWIPAFATCTAERAAYRNIAAGLLPPETATHKNPYREWIGAQIRGDFFGYVNPGDPRTAAEMAFRDASISHVKNGIYGEMFIAAMIAAAAVERDIRTIIETGLAYIPAKSRLTADVREIAALYDAGKSADEIIGHIHTRFNEYSANDWCYTNSNAMIVTMALLCGGGDFGTSVCLAVQSCFDTDCNGATVGSIVGIRNGEAAIDPYWYAPFEKRLYTSIEGYNLVEIPDLAKATFDLLKK